MNKFLMKGLLFCSPFLVCYVFIFIIDPYEFINVSHIIKSEDKFEVLRRSDESLPRGHMLWKTLHFQRKPVKNIIIGDSQAAGFNDSLISEISGEEYYNFAITGASYKTMFKVFWFATETTALERVYFQVGFMNYNYNRTYCIYHFAQDYFDNPYTYFTTKEILYDSYYNFLYYVTKDSDLIKQSYEHQPVETRDVRSAAILELFFNKYIYPDEYYEGLKEISDYCQTHNIELNFIIFPMYDAANDYIVENNLDEMNQRFKKDINSMGHTYDFDARSDFTKNRDNFIDYFHPISEAYVDISKEIWSK